MIDSKDIKYRSYATLAAEFGVTRKTIAYYAKRLGITPIRFPLDHNYYITTEDYQRLKEYRDGRQERY